MKAMTDKEKLKFQQFYNHIAGQSEVPMGYAPGGKLSIQEAFAVYTEGYKVRLTEALGDTYETVWKFAGDEIFFEVCEDYISKNPSTTYNLNDYGTSFPDYLKSLPAQNDYPFLYDLAVLDQNRNFLFHQKHECGIDGIKAQSLLKENSQLSFVSSMVFTKSNFDLVKIWKDLHADTFAADNSEEYTKPATILLFKDGDTTRVLSLSASTYTALKSLQSGKELTIALQELEPENVTELFKNLMIYQLIRNII